MEASLLNFGSQAASPLLDLLMRKENVYIMAATWSILQAIQKLIPADWTDHHLSVRLAPLYPMLLCSLAVWIPGLQPDGVQLGERMVIGFILGGSCGYLHKVFKQSVMGKDSRIEAWKAKPIVTDPPAPTEEKPASPPETP